MTSTEKEEKWTKDTARVMESHEGCGRGRAAEVAWRGRRSSGAGGLVGRRDCPGGEEEEGRTADQGPVHVQTVCGGVGGAGQEWGQEGVKVRGL